MSFPIHTSVITVRFDATQILSDFGQGTVLLTSAQADFYLQPEFDHCPTSICTEWHRSHLTPEATCWTSSVERVLRQSVYNSTYSYTTYYTRVCVYVRALLTLYTSTSGPPNPRCPWRSVMLSTEEIFWRKVSYPSFGIAETECQNNFEN
jgi:hypothetical protein